GRQKKQDSSSDPSLPTLEDTARNVTERGGEGIAVYCDHSNSDDVAKLFERVNNERNGQLDILVNNAFSAVDHLFKNMGQTFWESDISVWDEVNNVGLKNHYVCSALAARIMVKRRSGLIVNVSSAGGLKYAISVAYGVGKAALDRMAIDCAKELKNFNVACISLWPGPVRTEYFTGGKLSTDSTDQDAFLGMFKNGESIEYTGKCVAHLAQDRNIIQKSGKVYFTADLGDYYGFTDIDGRKPGNFRSVKTLLESAAWHKTAKWVPQWVKIPLWMMTFSGSKL
uniref:Dehydrogenase/reductase SDR family member 1 n=1 Tax=Romanomermis culicivorax TaxID=13658 RepID=A0A915KEB1_ROMCU